MKKHMILAIALAFATLALAQTPSPNTEAGKLFEQGQTAKKAGDMGKAAEAFRKSVELDPGYAPAHLELISAVNRDEIYKASKAVPTEARDSREVAVAKQSAMQRLLPLYNEWIQKYPSTAAVQWGVARLYRDDYEKSQPYLLKAVEFDPKFCQAWADLAQQALTAGEKIKARDYYKKTYDCEPGNGQYGEMYLKALAQVDMKAYRSAVDEYVARFANEQYAPRALAALADVLYDLDDKIAVLERLRKHYPPEKYANGGSKELFNAYLMRSPEKAAALAQSEAGKAKQDASAKSWKSAADYAQALANAQVLLRQNKVAEARDLLANVKHGNSSSEPLVLLRARAYEALADFSAAYKVLLEDVVRKRTKRTDAALKAAGAKLGKEPAKVEAEIWSTRFADAKPFKPFELSRFDNGEKVTLAGLKGKVVMLTFFFPGCHPCREEAPVLSQLYKKLRSDKFVMYAVNINPSENADVLPLFKNGKYPYPALRVPHEQWASETYDIQSAPQNILIDAAGRLVLRLEFGTPEECAISEQEIESLLQR